MRRTAKHTWQDYKTNEDILSELKNLTICKEKFKITEINRHMFGEWTDRLPH